MAKTFIGILSGGAGTRLWPMSRKNFPKQFYPLASSDPLLIETIKRVQSFGEVTLLTTEDLRSATLGLVNKHKMTAKIFSEPAPKNTAPVIAAFTQHCFLQDPKAVVIILPADHAIAPLAKFQKDLKTAIAIAQEEKIVTLGIPASVPSTAYGYMELQSKKPVSSVKQFREKPTAGMAAKLLKSGAVWNAGIFIFSAKKFLSELKEKAPEYFKGVQPLKVDQSNIKAVYEKLPTLSIDYALMEKLKDLECVRASFKWSDLGSWEEVAAHSHADEKPLEVDAKNNFYSKTMSSSKKVAFVGVKDLIVSETPDALLVVKRGSGQEVKRVVEAFKKSAPQITEDHSFEERPWGRFDILLDTKKCKSKLITVWSGQRLSYQSHKKRSEHWIVVEGAGEFTLNDQKRPVKSGDYLHIPLGAKHRIANTGTEVLKFVEVQEGTYFGEDDIQRYDDDYGRS